MIPPLPEERNGSTIGTRHLWVILYLHREYQADEVKAIFVNLFGREPDRLVSPEEDRQHLLDAGLKSDLGFWWLGWVTKQEADKWMEQNK